MKKPYRKIILILLLFAMMMTAFAGCKAKDETVEPEGLFPEPHVAPQITELTESSTTISWESQGSGVKYNVYKADSRNGSYKMIATTSNTRYTDETEGASVKLSLASYYRVTSISGGYETKPTLPASQETKVFSDYTYIFSPDDDPAKINEELAEVFVQQEPAQFDRGRYAYMFKRDKAYTSGNNTSKATYNNVKFNIGFYTDVMGLGRLPTDTTVGDVRIDANWLGIPGPNGDSNATCNFWRGISNMSLNPQIQSGQTKNTLWAVSQAAPMRRMYINGNLQLTTTTGTKNWGSGGFIADTYVTGNVSAGGQQQFYFRNTEATAFSGGQWNMVYQGTKGAVNSPKDSGKTTIVDKTPIIQEKPFLFIDENDDYKVFVPTVIRDAGGVSWGDGKANDGMGEGYIKDISDFYIAKWRDDDDVTLNKALSEGKSIILTPGIYRINAPLVVSKPGTIVMGLGYATLENQENTESMIITAKGPVNGVNISGIIFDAGGKGSPCLLKVGNDRMDYAEKNTPVLLSDLFFRVGGDIVATADTCVIINIDNTIGDDFWVWRADHGAEVTWLKNVTKNGLIVNGNDVTMYALMCEHFHEYQTIWNGENGRLYFYQSELPYDVINQKDWIAPDGANGYASYKVADNVRKHEAWGLGVYSCFTRTGDPPLPPLSGYADGLTYVYLDSAIEVPNSQGVIIHNACTVYLASDNTLRNRPAIKNVVNSFGGAIYAPVNRSFVEQYCDPISGLPSIVDGEGTEIKTGKFGSAQTIYLQSPVEGAKILYTLNGTAPGPSNSASIEYDGQPLTVGVQDTAVILSVILAKGNSVSAIKKVTIVLSDDLAAFQPVKASSYNGSQLPSNAVNGLRRGSGASNDAGRWEAATAGSEWWAVDLGYVCAVNRIKIEWQSANSCSYAYSIYYSNDDDAWENPEDMTKWTEITEAKKTNNTAQDNDINITSSVQARYLMLKSTRTANGAPSSPPNNSYKLSMWNFWVYGAAL